MISIYVTNTFFTAAERVEPGGDLTNIELATRLFAEGLAYGALGDGFNAELSGTVIDKLIGVGSVEGVRIMLDIAGWRLEQLGATGLLKRARKFCEGGAASSLKSAQKSCEVEVGLNPAAATFVPSGFASAPATIPAAGPPEEIDWSEFDDPDGGLTAAELAELEALEQLEIEEMEMEARKIRNSSQEKR